MSDYVTVIEGDTCGRGYDGSPCSGEVFMRTSRSGLTVAPICEGHSMALDRILDNVADRYPEINHPGVCDCTGCTGPDYGY